ncbi:MAG TPA: branched-chain amino acid ABC transporter substrate-binding protein, partial [Rhodobacteraceae bacterium]|nr:branched-chain amino acid ABC transporter substrate-binding protein [Paracoccaceae bacterium]
TAAAERLVTADKVNAIVGADCSGVTGAVLQNVARANGIVMVSPSATSPALSTAEDDGLFFRT